MKVKDIMSTDIACIREDASILQAAHIMRKNNIGSIPICNDTGCLIGIITDRDIIVRALARFESENNITHNLTELRLKDIMSTDIVCASPDMSIHDAALLLAHHKIRRLPVTETSRIVGMLSLGDIASKPVHIDEAGDVLSAISIIDNLL